MDKNEMEFNDIINRIKTCPNCKAVVNDDKFCHNCGAKLTSNDDILKEDVKEDNEDINVEEKKTISIKKKILISIAISFVVILSVLIPILINTSSNISTNDEDLLTSSSYTTNEVGNNEKDIFEEERISLFDIGTVRYKDFDMDSPYRATGLAITISRIETEKYPELLYVYEIIGEDIIEPIRSQYAYKSLDTLLSDIQWVGNVYNYLTPPNIYEPFEEYEYSGPSPLDGISQSEYDAIKNGEYDHIEIIDDNDNTDNNSEDNSKEYVTLPDFTNYNTIEDIQREIDQYNANLNLDLKLNVVYDSQYPYGEIKSQSIGVGQKAYSGDTITVTVGNKIEQSNLIVKIFPYNYLGLNMDMNNYVIPEELSVVPVTIIINGNTVYNEMVRIENRETKVEETFKVSLYTTVEIKVNGKTVFNRSKDFGAKAKTWTLDDMPEF